MGNNLARALENSTSVNAFALFLAVCCSLTRSAAVPIGRRRARITFQTDHNPIRMHQKSIRCVVLVRLLLLLHRRRREFLFLFLFCTSRTADLLAFRILFFILHNLFSTISQKAVGLPFNENKKETRPGGAFKATDDATLVLRLLQPGLYENDDRRLNNQQTPNERES